MAAPAEDVAHGRTLGWPPFLTGGGAEVGKGARGGQPRGRRATKAERPCSAQELPGGGALLLLLGSEQNTSREMTLASAGAEALGHPCGVPSGGGGARRVCAEQKTGGEQQTQCRASLSRSLAGKGKQGAGAAGGARACAGEGVPLGKPVLCGPERGRAKEGGWETETERGGGGGDVRGRQLRGGFALGGSRDALSTGVREA